MRVRYRLLKSSLDPAEIAREAREHGQGYRDDDPISDLQARVEAPRKVQAEEYETTLEEMQGLVRAGTLKAGDLVNTGHGWTTVEDCPELLDALEAVATPKQRRGWVAAVIAVGVLIAGYLIYRY